MQDHPVLLITGASSGIGAATARAAAPHYRLVLAARRLDELEAIAKELGGRDRAIAVQCDVTQWDAVQAMVDAATGAFGQIDGVFANAGFGVGSGFLEGSPERWEAMILTNVLGVALTIRGALPHLLERGSGHFLITSSTAGRRPLPGSIYSATKHAVTALGESLRAELRQLHDNTSIKVTLIEPGVTDTPFFDAGPGEWALRDEDVARAVLFALEQGAGVDVNEILIRSTSQPL